MGADDLLLRLVALCVAAMGTWGGAALLLFLFRVRDASLRAAVWTWAVATPPLVLAGLRPGGVLRLDLVVPEGYPLLADRAFVGGTLALWAAGAALLVARGLRREARLAACIDGIVATCEVPADLADAVQRTARWLGVPAPRIAACEGDGTAFVTGVRAPALCVPLALWRRLDVRGRRALLLHELAHVRRRDPARLRALSIVADVLWPAFALRASAERLRDAWEAQADDAAVHAGATRTALAASLLAAWTAGAPRNVLAFGAARAP